MQHGRGRLSPGSAELVLGEDVADLLVGRVGGWLGGGGPVCGVGAGFEGGGGVVLGGPGGGEADVGGGVAAGEVGAGFGDGGGERVGVWLLGLLLLLLLLVVVVVVRIWVEEAGGAMWGGGGIPGADGAVAAGGDGEVGGDGRAEGVAVGVGGASVVEGLLSGGEWGGVEGVIYEVGLARCVRRRVVVKGADHF